MSRPVSATISSINPSTVTAGTTNFTLTVTGSGFIVNSVQVNGSNRPTTFFSPLNFVLGTTQPFRVQSSSSLGAPLSVLNLALTHPRDGTVAMLGQELNAQAVLGGTGTGTVIGRQRIEFLSLFVDQVTCMHSCRRTARWRRLAELFSALPIIHEIGQFCWPQARDGRRPAMNPYR